MNHVDFLSRLTARERPPIDARGVAVVAAHPDDEVVGVGAQLPRLQGVSILHVTNGAPAEMPPGGIAGFAMAEDYAAARRRETEAAVDLAGIAADRVDGLGITDQAASLDMANLACRIADWMRDHGVEIVLTHPYEGGHPDHDATAFAVDLAGRIVERDGGRRPVVVEFTSYHGFGWRLRPRRPVVHRFLPTEVLPVMTPDGRKAHAFDRLMARIARTSDPGAAVPLSEAEQTLKQAMMDCFVTQFHAMALFRPEMERFRLAPFYDFTRAPHPGLLNYERRNWGIDGAAWRRLAADALAAVETDTKAAAWETIAAGPEGKPSVVPFKRRI